MDEAPQVMNGKPTAGQVKIPSFVEQLDVFYVVACIYGFIGEDKQFVGSPSESWWNIPILAAFAVSRACFSMGITNVLFGMRQFTGCPADCIQVTTLIIYGMSALLASYVPTSYINMISWVLPANSQFIILTAAIAVYLMFEDIQSSIAKKPSAGGAGDTVANVPKVGDSGKSPFDRIFKIFSQWKHTDNTNHPDPAPGDNQEQEVVPNQEQPNNDEPPQPVAAALARAITTRSGRTYPQNYVR